MAEVDVMGLLEQMKEKFDPQKAGNLKGIIQLSLTGEGGGDYYLEINNGTFDAQRGKHAKPDLTLSATAEDYVKISTGKMDPMMAFFQGKIKATGDITLAQKLQNLFK